MIMESLKDDDSEPAAELKAKTVAALRTYRLYLHQHTYSIVNVPVVDMWLCL